MEQTQQIERWSKTQRAEMKAQPFNREVLRALVDYRMGALDKRKATGNQIGAIERATDTTPDLGALALLNADFSAIERKSDAAIEAMVRQHEAGRWALSIEGIGPIFVGVLLAHIDLHPWVCEATKTGTRRAKCSPEEPCSPDCHEGYTNTVGKLWRFAGLDPTVTWEKGKRRPHNALLKCVAWQIGESFKKLGDRGGLYSRLYRQRKAQEIERNEKGLFREQALARLEKATKAKWNISPLQRETWASGKLQPIGLDMRAGRYAAKLFLSHFHHVLHCVEEGCEPPVPYILGAGGHADFVAPPNWPMAEEKPKKVAKRKAA